MEQKCNWYRPNSS